ncbi:MAG: dihydroorotase [Gammaproteobacteria bacterium]|nr:dihydroorotase [Gammaproteobacteria bacterium]
MMDKISIIRPDDWHLHLRDTPYLRNIVGHTANQFGRAIIMPNLQPPICSCSDAGAYRQRILHALPATSSFQPLMTLYLTDNTCVEEIKCASQADFILGAKLYPAGATTNSDDGVTNLGKNYPVFEAMQEHGLRLLIHGEATATEIDIFDREKRFIEQSLLSIRKDFPQLHIVFEHITTSEAVDYVSSADEYIAATITPHHLLINRNALLVGGIQPHHYCLPIAKRESHRQALVTAATGGTGKFFAGTDSAPHARNAKESACGCAGIYSAFSAIELYAEAFEQAQDFSNFEAFMSINGPNFYDLAVNQGNIELGKTRWTVPDSLDYADDQLIPFMAGKTLSWQLLG